ncbi:hypothetical protein PUN28_002557 [Cardiocondyla obscurior]|uniref:Uncharacterized protein n=1 Tax=Cardiocondyla obscurior TaxID=286306 RepID=A0AAW2GV36_9HYME
MQSIRGYIHWRTFAIYVEHNERYNIISKNLCLAKNYLVLNNKLFNVSFIIAFAYIIIMAKKLKNSRGAFPRGYLTKLQEKNFTSRC